MSVADVVDPLVRAGLGADLPVRLRCWDGSELGPPAAPVQLTFTSPRPCVDCCGPPTSWGSPAPTSPATF